MLTVADVGELIRKKLRGKMAANAIIDGDSVLNDFGLSSLQIADLVYSIEDRLEIEFDPARAAEVKTVGHLVALANEYASRSVAEPERA